MRSSQGVVLWAVSVPASACVPSAAYPLQPCGALFNLRWPRDEFQAAAAAAEEPARARELHWLREGRVAPGRT